MGKITVCSNVHGVSWGCDILAVFLPPEMERYSLGICEWKQGRGSRWRVGGGGRHWFLICGLYHSRGHLQSITWNFHELHIYLQPHAINIELREGLLNQHLLRVPLANSVSYTEMQVENSEVNTDINLWLQITFQLKQNPCHFQSLGSSG